MSFMFSNCSSFTSLNLSNFNLQNVIEMICLFNDCNSSISLNIPNLNTENIIDMSCMFNRCNSLNFQSIFQFFYLF